MKRWIALLLTALLMLALPVLSGAEETTYTTDLAYDYTALCFDGAAVPEPVRAAMADSAFAGDTVVQGVLMTEIIRQTGVEHQWTSLMEVEHGGERLLIAARCTDRRRVSCVPVSEIFLSGVEGYQLTTLQDEAEAVPTFVIRVPGGDYWVSPEESDLWRLTRYTLTRADGSTFCVADGNSMDSTSTLIVTETDSASRQTVTNVPCCRPLALEALTVQELPDSLAAVQAMAALYPSPLTESIAATMGAHLRRGASEQTADLGEYSGALMRVEAEVPGRSNAWVRVRIGDRVGWMSGIYVCRRGGTMAAYLEGRVMPVCRAEKDVVLLADASADAAQGAVVTAGTVMQVLTESNGYLHVCIPHNSEVLTATLDGVYGFIPAEDAVQAASPLLLKYR